MATQALTRGREREAVEVSGRVGLVARGVIYLVVGTLALLLAIGHPASKPNRRGALEAVASQPFGRVLVIALAVGFVAFAVWRAVEAVAGDKWPQRAANAGRALLYVGFFMTAAKFVMHGPAEGQTDSHEADITARVLGWPGGRFIVMAVGLAIISAGIWNGYRGLSQRYRKKLKWREMTESAERIVPTVATVGLVGRMSAFVLVGAFVTKAGWDYRPSDAAGLDAALFRLIEATHGPLLVALVGVGLVAFGLYSFVEARYRDLPQN